MDVSKNRGKTPKWMVYNGKPYLLMDDLGGFPIIFGNTHMLRIEANHMISWQRDIPSFQLLPGVLLRESLLVS